MNQFHLQKMLFLPSQLSYRVNESLSGGAVRDSEGGLPAEAGAKGQKHAAIGLSDPKEMPYES
jgi:hypothetical protein